MCLFPVVALSASVGLSQTKVIFQKEKHSGHSFIQSKKLNRGWNKSSYLSLQVTLEPSCNPVSVTRDHILGEAVSEQGSPTLSNNESITLDKIQD